MPSASVWRNKLETLVDVAYDGDWEAGANDMVLAMDVHTAREILDGLLDSWGIDVDGDGFPIDGF